MTEKMRRRIALALSAVLACLPALVQAQTAELQKGLAQLFATAEQHNATLRSLETALQTAEAGVITAQAAKLPDITGEAAVSYLGNARLWNRQFGESTAAPMPHFGNNFSLAARQVVYGGGGINAGIQLARQGGKLAQLNAEDGKQRVRFLLTGLYLQLHNLRNGQEVNAANAALARQLIEQMHKRREHVLEMVYYEEVMHYADHIYERLNQWSLPGIWAGCLFSLGWLRLMRWNAYKLIAVGLAVFSLYASGFYFLADSSLNSEALRLPLVFRGFSYAVLSIALMWCLHEIMSFQHFFQALSIFNILHMFVGGLAGAALHARGLNYYVADGFARYSGYLDEVRGLQTPVDFARYMEQMVENLLAQSVKILFGWTLYAALFFALLMLLWDIPGVRRRVKHMQTWPCVGLQVLNGVRRQQKLLRLRRKRSKME